MPGARRIGRLVARGVKRLKEGSDKGLPEKVKPVGLAYRRLHERLGGDSQYTPPP